MATQSYCEALLLLRGLQGADVLDSCVSYIYNQGHHRKLSGLEVSSHLLFDLVPRDALLELDASHCCFGSHNS